MQYGWQRKQMLAVGLTMEGPGGHSGLVAMRDLKLRRGLVNRRSASICDLAGKNSIHLTGFLGGGSTTTLSGRLCLTGRSDLYTAIRRTSRDPQAPAGPFSTSR
jgi:hypothetical protein